MRNVYVHDMEPPTFVFGPEQVHGDTGESYRQTFAPDSTTVRAFFEKKRVKFANFWRARFRLYQNEILQVNMRLTAFFKLYKMCTLLHRCDRKIFAKNRFEKSAIFVKIQQKFANVAKFAKYCQISKISA